MCLMVLLLTACYSSKAQLHSMDTVAAQIDSELSKRRDVRKVDVTYQDNLEAVGTAYVGVAAEPGQPSEPIADEAVRRVWQSTLQPLGTIVVDVYYADHSRPTLHLDYLVKEKGADLQRKYGKRPL
jgi:hypothetical protein